MRGIFVGPGSSGKTVVLQWLLQGPWRNLADKIAIWSPTIFLQPDWEPILDIMKHELDQTGDKLWVFEDFDQAQMDQIVNDWTDQTREDIAAAPGRTRETFEWTLEVDRAEDPLQLLDCED